MVCVPDLARGMETYRRIGFDIRAGGVHTGKGTHNAIAFHEDDYLELLAVRNRFDLVNRAWNNLVVQFSLLRQQNLLTPFGIAKAEYYDLVWVLVGSSTLLLALYSWWVLRRPRKPGDALDAAYSLLCRNLKAIGMPRAVSEGPVAFAGRLHRADGSMPAWITALEWLPAYAMLGVVGLVWIAAIAGVLLLFGLWTPLAGLAISIVEVWILWTSVGNPLIPLMLATLGITVAMIGPGAWSIDAQLYGRKHIESSSTVANL